MPKREGEKALAEFDHALKAPNASRAAVVAKTEAHLLALADRDARMRRFAMIFAFVASGLMAAAEVGLAIADAQGEDVPVGLHVMLSATAAGFFGLGWLVDTTRTPSERILNLYRTDPDLGFRVGLAPTHGGAALSLSGRF